MLWVAEVAKLHLTAGFDQPEMDSVLARNHGGIACIWRLNTTVLKIANERMKHHTSLKEVMLGYDTCYYKCIRGGGVTLCSAHAAGGRDTQMSFQSLFAAMQWLINVCIRYFRTCISS